MPKRFKNKLKNLPDLPEAESGRSDTLHEPLHKSSRSFWLLFLCLIIAGAWLTIYIENRGILNGTSHGLSSEELAYRIEQAARKEGIAQHLPELQAIVKVESNGQSEDVFQSSESLGLPPNSLSVDESIDQGVSYYKDLLEKADQLNVDQDAVFQAYNYGSGYLDFVAQNGGKHTPALAEEFSRIHSDGRIVTYPNPVAIESNGGWRYDYGNMFYVQLIHNVLNPDIPDSEVSFSPSA
ncbi:lysozyme family protein [Erysipelotrichaceae bacterium 51-3]